MARASKAFNVEHAAVDAPTAHSQLELSGNEKSEAAAHADMNFEIHLKLKLNARTK